MFEADAARIQRFGYLHTLFLLQISIPLRPDGDRPFQAFGPVKIRQHCGTKQEGGFRSERFQILHEDAVGLVRFEEVEALGLLDAHTLVLRHIDGDVRPVRLRYVGVAGRAQHLGGIEVDDQSAARPLAGAVKAHHPVDVLRGCRHQRHAGCCSEDVDELRLDLGFSRKFVVGVQPSQRGTFHQQQIDVAGWVCDQLFE